MQKWTREHAHYMAKLYDNQIVRETALERDTEKLEVRLPILQRKLDKWKKQENSFLNTLKNEIWHL